MTMNVQVCLVTSFLFLLLTPTAYCSKSSEKCVEYGEFVNVKAISAALMAKSTTVETSECSIEKVPLVVGGTIAKPKEFPHMVAIGYGTKSNVKWMCGGSLISETFVLTAAHCAYSPELGNATLARFGITDVSGDDDGLQDLDIEARILHPGFAAPSRYNDIALFKLSEPVEISPYVRPACLHTEPAITESKAVACGWGKTDYENSEGSPQLMKVALSIISSDQCNNTYLADVGGNALKDGVIETQLCAGELAGGKDTCQGDSGGPLQLELDHPYCMYTIVGVTSFGKFCGFKNAPAIYTRVSSFVPWIESLVWP